MRVLIPRRKKCLKHRPTTLLCRRNEGFRNRLCQGLFCFVLFSNIRGWTLRPSNLSCGDGETLFFYSQAPPFAWNFVFLIR